MIIKYLLKALSALANHFSLLDGTDFRDEKSASALNRDGINYLNVSPIFGRFPRRRRRTFSLLPKSIVMEMELILNLITPIPGLI